MDIIWQDKDVGFPCTSTFKYLKHTEQRNKRNKGLTLQLKPTQLEHFEMKLKQARIDGIQEE